MTSIAPQLTDPRTLTPHVRWRAWIEPRVRFWILSATGMAFIGLALGFTQIHSAFAERRLANQPAVPAVIRRFPNEDLPNRPVPPGSPLTVEFLWNGALRQESGFLTGFKSGQAAKIGQTIFIHVDPEDPTRWTARNEEESALAALAGMLLCLGLALLPLSAALISRSRVLRTWLVGEIRPAVAMSRQQTALAPASRLVRCAWAEGGDRRIFTVYVPARSAEASPEGETIRVLVPAGRSDRPLAVAWFEG